MSDIGSDDCIILNKYIDSYVQAARQFYKKAVEIMKKLGLIWGNANPCFYVKKSKKGMVHVVLNVDNILMIGDAEVINKATTALKESGLVLKAIEGPQDYLSWQWKDLHGRSKGVSVGSRYVIIPGKAFQTGYGQHNQGTVKS